MNNLQGYHVEWNLGCPGGWEYQRMAQERGKLCWSRFKELSGIGIQLSFDHPLFNPVPSLSAMLLRVYRTRFQGETPFSLLVAEREAMIARLQPWGGSPALIASDGLFSFGAHLEDS